MPAPTAGGPDEADLPDDPQPLSPGAPAAALAELSQWRESPEAGQAIVAVNQLEDCYDWLDRGCAEAEEEIEVATVRYKHALRRLQAAIPEAVPELVLEPRMANEHNSMPCPYGFGRLVRRPWELQLPELGYCEPGCMCEALLGARNETVCCSGVGWGEYGTPCNGAGWYGLPGGPDDPDGLTYICRA